MTAIFSILRLMESFLGAAVLAAVSYIIFFITTHQHVDFIIDQAPSLSVEASGVLAGEDKPYSYYAKKTKARDLFGFAVKPQQAQGASRTLPVGQLPSNFKVVGIVLGDRPEIILEDTNIKQTYFIQQGKKQAGIGLERVVGNKVFLQYRGQSVEVPVHNK